MSLKKSYNEVKLEFENRGYTLLSKEYINNSTNLDIKCPNKHITKITFNSFKNGRNCRVCAGKEKYNLKVIQQIFNKEGYQLLTKEYRNTETSLMYRCPNGHVNTTKIYYFKTVGNRCPDCYGNKRYTLNQVREFFSKRGYELLSGEYKNAHAKLNYKCSSGHINSIKLNDFKKGHGCSICAGNKNYTIDEIRKIFLESGYTLISKKYTNNKTPLIVKCKNNHIVKKSLVSLTNGRNCLKCSIIHSYSSVKENFKKHKYILLSKEYLNNDSKLEYICPKGHTGTVRYRHFLSDVRCSTCKSSKGEIKIQEYLDKHRINYEQQKTFNDLKYISYLKYDFFLPDYNMLIEYNGRQHYELVEAWGDFDKIKKRDLIKRQYAFRNGFELLILKYDEFEIIEKRLNEQLKCQ